MRIATVRRICQVFFLAVFFWFCIAATLGGEWWRLRGWPINWILSLDPLTAFSTMLSTGTLYEPLLWALVTIVLTVFFGRFFCGFACPLGTLNQFFGWLGQRGRKQAHRIAANRLRGAQVLKYYLLAFLLACAALGTLQTGVFDPLPLLHRSINLTIAPLLDANVRLLSLQPRHYASAWLIGAVLLAVLGLNLLIPRFFCRFLCPLGALFGLLSRFSPWRIGKNRESCGDCHLCETHCEGACRPSGKIVLSECVLCCNCLEGCHRDRIGFSPKPSAAGETHGLPDLSRRGLIAAGAFGILAGPLWRLGALAGDNASPLLIRPPGSLDEERFLARCIRCGQCMRVCPTNVIQPALLEAGIDGLWTPALNYRIGASGCQLNCIACGHVCPTAAIRPLSLEEKLGRGNFADAGPVRVGTAFVDRTRCLPWVMGRPCLVCQEVCPVSPKAIYTQTVFQPVRNGRVKTVQALGDAVEVSGLDPAAPNLGGGDFYLRRAEEGDAQLRRIVGAAGPRFTLAGRPGWKTTPAPGDTLEIAVRLQQPYVDAARCIGCGVCEHECPVSRLRAIRVSPENESRSRRGRMLL